MYTPCTQVASVENGTAWRLYQRSRHASPSSKSPERVTLRPRHSNSLAYHATYTLWKITCWKPVANKHIITRFSRGSQLCERIEWLPCRMLIVGNQTMTAYSIMANVWPTATTFCINKPDRSLLKIVGRIFSDKVKQIKYQLEIKRNADRHCNRRPTARI